MYEHPRLSASRAGRNHNALRLFVLDDFPLFFRQFAKKLPVFRRRDVLLDFFCSVPLEISADKFFVV